MKKVVNKKKKGINSKEKGDRYERHVYNLFKKHWGVVAYRTPGSGALTSRAVSKAMKDAAAGDVVIEELPDIIIECKNYKSLYFSHWFKEKSPTQSIKAWWEKLDNEAIEFKKIPFLICKEYRSPDMIVMDECSLKVFIEYESQDFIKESITFRGDGHKLLTIVPLDEILSLDIETLKLIILEMVKKRY